MHIEVVIEPDEEVVDSEEERTGLTEQAYELLTEGIASNIGRVVSVARLD